MHSPTMTFMRKDGTRRTPLRTALNFAVLTSFVLAGCSPRSATPSMLRARLLAGGFASPVELTSPPDHSGRLFVVDQVGLIWVLSNGKRIEQPFLDLRDRLVQLLPFYDERGLLALAFHPLFATNGLFYVYYSAPLAAGLSPDQWDHTTHVSEFKVSAQDPDRADPASERILLSIDKPGYNYEGGGLAFGPDGYLYIGTGDSVHDPSTQAGKYAQDTHSLLGKILRIDVNAPGADVNASPPSQRYHIPNGNPFYNNGGRPEIFAYGFRNPYRISFDKQLIVGDVGQAVMEEADVVSSGGNYGWPIREGTTCFDQAHWNQPLPRCAAAGLIGPVLAYPHAGKASAIIGGAVYRGAALPGLYGDFVFGDWGRGMQRLFAAHPPANEAGLWNIESIHIEIPGSPEGQLLGIGTDQEHELYLLTKDLGMGPGGASGRIYRVLPP